MVDFKNVIFFLKNAILYFALYFFIVPLAHSSNQAFSIKDFIKHINIDIEYSVGKEYIAVAHLNDNDLLVVKFKTWCVDKSGSYVQIKNGSAMLFYCRSDHLVGNGVLIGVSPESKVYFYDLDFLNSTAFLSLVKDELLGNNKSPETDFIEEVRYSAKMDKFFSSYSVAPLTADAKRANGYEVVINEFNGNVWKIAKVNSLKQENSEKLVIDPSNRIIFLGADGRAKLNENGSYRCQRMLHFLRDGRRDENSYDVCRSKFTKDVDSTGSSAARGLSAIGLLGLGHLDFVSVDSEKILESLNSLSPSDVELLINEFGIYLRKINQQKGKIIFSRVIQDFEKKLAKDDFLSRKIDVGEKVCADVKSVSGLIKVSAFVEQDTGQRLNLRINSTERYDKIYFNDGSFWGSGVITWDSKSNWTFCENSN